jgi:hypothetical protein
MKPMMPLLVAACALPALALDEPGSSSLSERYRNHPVLLKALLEPLEADKEARLKNPPPVRRPSSEGLYENAQPGCVLLIGQQTSPTFVHRWHILGPFTAEADPTPHVHENTSGLIRPIQSSNFDFGKLPDLEQSIPGPDGELMRWTGMESSVLRAEPTKASTGAVYYAFSAVCAEKAGKYWLALGADDWGQVWLNGEQLWRSDTTPKVYRADENVVEVDLREGPNDLILRCENRGGTMGWSAVFLPAE